MTGSLPGKADDLENLLAPGGRMFVVTGQDPIMQATLNTRGKDGKLRRRNLCETTLPALRNAPEPEAFVF